MQFSQIAIVVQHKVHNVRHLFCSALLGDILNRMFLSYSLYKTEGASNAAAYGRWPITEKGPFSPYFHRVITKSPGFGAKSVNRRMNSDASLVLLSQ